MFDEGWDPLLLFSLFIQVYRYLEIFIDSFWNRYIPNLIIDHASWAFSVSS
jgi:hypothetical protein